MSDIVAIHKSGLGFNVPNFIKTRRNILFPQISKTDVENKNPFLLEEVEEQQQLDVIEVAIVSQTIKLLYYTLIVLEEDDDDDKTNEEDVTKKIKNTSMKKKKSGSSGRGFG